MVSARQGIYDRINCYQTVLITALALQLMSLMKLSVLLPEVLRPVLVITALIFIPGIMTAALLYREQSLPIWQVIGLGIGFGIAEALLWGRLLLTIGAATPWLAYVLLLTTLIKIACLWRRPFQVQSTSTEQLNWRLMFIPLLTLLVIWVTLINVNLTYSTYPVDTIQINDKWSYLTIIEQFRVSPDHLNLSPDAVIFGSNTRLSWNSWLYFLAAISHFTDIHPVQLIFHDLRPGLFILTIYGLYLLGYELFHKHWMALAAGVLQILLVIGVDYEGFWVWMRLEEDKFFAFVTLMPLAWLFLLRALNNRRWPDVIGLMGVSLSLALTHPIGLPGLLLTGMPVIVADWWLNRRHGFSFRWMVILLISMGIFIGITMLDQILIVATPYVQSYIEVKGSLPVYTISNVPALLPANARFILLALIPLAIFSLKERVARFLFLVTVACAAVLCVPIVTVLVSELSTAVGINRYRWLIPYGFIVMWILLKVVERWFAYLPRLLNSAGLTAASVGLVVLLSGWHQWRVDHNLWLLRQDTPEPITVLNEGLWKAFLETADDVIGKRVVTPVEYGLITPTLWPGADVLIFNSPIHAPLNWRKIDALYQSQDIATAWMFLDELQPQVLLVPHLTNLYTVISENPDSFDARYVNEEATLYISDIAPTRLKGDSLTFTADQYTLKPGECTSLQWQANDLQNIRLNGQPVAGEDKRRACPTETTVFTLQGLRVDGSIARRTLHIFVSPDYDYMVSFGADRYVIQSGECVILRWHVEGINSIYYQEEPTVGLASTEECPSVDTLYSLRIMLRNQETIIRNITIYVRSDSQ